MRLNELEAKQIVIMDKLIHTWEENGQEVTSVVKCEEHCPEPHASCYCHNMMEVRKKLGAYEDTGMTPEEIISLKKELEKLTPGGSEFYNDPDKCLAWIKMQNDCYMVQVKWRKKAEAERDQAVKDLKETFIIINESQGDFHGLETMCEDYCLNAKPGDACYKQTADSFNGCANFKWRGLDGATDE